MRTSSSNYDTYNALLYKQPVFIVEFGAITTKFVSGTFSNIGSYTTKKYIVSVRGSFGQIDIHESLITNGTWQIYISDKSEEFISFLSSNNLIGQACTIKIGFQELEYADFTTATSNNTVVDAVSANDDLITWVISARDTIFDLFGAKFNNTAELPDSQLRSGETLGAGSTDIRIDDETNYADPADPDFANLLDSRVIACVKVEEEIIRYENVVNGGANSPYLDTITLAIAGTTSPTSHTALSKIRRGIGFMCDPLRAMLHILTSSPTRTNGPYDLGTLSSGLTTAEVNYRGMYKNGKQVYVDEANINIENIEQLGWRMFHEIEYDAKGCFYLFYEDRFDVLDTIQNKLLKPYGLYLVIRDGKLDVGSNDYVYDTENFSADDAFDMSNIKTVSDFQQTDELEIHDRYSFNYHINHGTEEFALTFEKIHNNTALTFYNQSPLLINHIGMNTGADTDQITNMVKYRFNNFADSNTLVRLSSFYENILLETGDTPTITHDKLPNVFSGARGWTTQKALIVGQEIDFAADTCNITHLCRVFDLPGYVRDVFTNDVYYTVNKVAQGSIDDTTLSVSTDLTATTEAADAYYDNSVSAYQADRIIFFITITPPGFGGGSDNEILDLQISWLDNVPAIQNSDRRRYIRFNPQSSTAFTIALDLYGTSASADTPDRVKVDWNSTTATGSEIPTVAFVGVWFVKTNLVTA